MSSAAVPPPATPRSWRVLLLAAFAGLFALAYVADAALGPRARSLVGAVAFVVLVAAFSDNLRRVSWRTVGFGILLQAALIVVVLFAGFSRAMTDAQKDDWRASQAAAVVGSALGRSPFVAVLQSSAEAPDTYFYRPGYEVFRAAGDGVMKFLEFTNAGSRFVFGAFADPAVVDRAFPGQGFVFAFSALPTIVFVSSFFTLLYYFGVLQFVVRVFAKAMMYFMRTSGAETLSVAANVFMGQTEAPIIVKPYIARMTQSELLALMVGGMATISGGVMAVYISMGADPVAILTTSVMAAPCSLYLSKLLLPETETPATAGTADTAVERTHTSAIDAASAGASEGMQLAINITAMLIAFLALIAMIDAILAAVHPSLSLTGVFGTLFAPVAYLMGVERADLFKVGDLLGVKLVANEFVAYAKLTGEYRLGVSPRSYALATFALTGFANFASIGIQLGGIGAMAPERRPDLARLGVRALFVGFVTTLVNACLAGAVMPE